MGIIHPAPELHDVLPRDADELLRERLEDRHDETASDGAGDVAESN